MTASDLTPSEVEAFGAVGSARSEDDFVTAFRVLVEVVSVRPYPYKMIGAFVRGMIQGRGVVADLPSVKPFVAAFSAYAEGACAREASTVEAADAIARFAREMIEGSGEAVADLMRCGNGGAS